MIVSTPVYFCVANSRWTGPVNVPSRRNTIAVHVPPTGLRTSTCPWLPLPCGRVYAAYAPVGSISASPTRAFGPLQASYATSRSVPAGIVNVVDTNGRWEPN